MRIFYPGQKGAQVDYGNSHDDDNVDGLRFLPPGVRDPSDISDDNAPVVATDVLKRFGIPFRASGNLMSGSRGRAKGHDIRSMAAPEAIRLSLAEFMIDSKLVEVYADVDGVARFISIGNESWNPPDFFIAKSVTKLADQNVQLVVIRGYDRPPKRKIKTSKMIRLLQKQPGSNVGPVIVRSINPSDAGSQSFGSSSNPSHGSPTFLRHTSIVNKYASIVYQEPSWDDSYKNGLLNAYHPQCFESLIAWKTRINEEAKRAYDIDAKINLSNNSVISVLLTSSDIAGSYNYNPNATNTPWATLKLNPTNKEVGIFNNVSLRNLIYRQNLYGEHVYTFENISNLFLIGRRISVIYQGISGNSWDYTEDELTVFELSEGTEYTWRIDETDSSRTTIAIDFYINLARPSGQAVWPGNNIPGPPYFPIGGGLGYEASSIYANLSVNLPSVNIYSPRGKAVEIAEALIPDFIEMTPVVIQDVPAPVYYRFNTDIFSPPNDVGYPVAGRPAGFIPHEQDLVDSDPNTVQNLDSTPSKRLQDSGATRVIDVSLPFIRDGYVMGNDPENDGGSNCTKTSINEEFGSGSENDIIAVRDFIFNLYNSEPIEHQTQYIYSGAILSGSLPFLGQKHSGSSDEIINGISYSMQDEASFQVTVSTGRKLTTVGSWGTEIYERRTETVTRTATVTRVAGNGALYTVKVDGMGSYGAISTLREELVVGDRCTVSIYNNPVEA